MTRTGPSKGVDALFVEGRLVKARAFKKAATTLALLGDANDFGDPIVSEIVNATIAYIDALTGRFVGRINQQDHQAAVALLRQALGSNLPKAQSTTLRRILDEKDSAQYGSRIATMEEARALLERFNSFSGWAEGLLT